MPLSDNLHANRLSRTFDTAGEFRMGAENQAASAEAHLSFQGEQRSLRNSPAVSHLMLHRYPGPDVI
jgi:hypothetical protein